MNKQNQATSSAQFTTRQMFVLLVGFSIFCAILGAVLQQLPMENRMGAMAYIFGLIAFFLVLLVLAIRRRAGAEKQAGVSRKVVSSRLSTWYHIGGITTIVFSLMLMIGGLILIALPNAELPEGWSPFMLFTQFSLVVFTAGSYLVCMVWWRIDPKALDVRENGIMIGPWNFTPWKFFHGFKWNQFTGNLMLLTDGGYMEFKVPEKTKDELTTVLREFLLEK